MEDGPAEVRLLRNASPRSQPALAADVQHARPSCGNVRHKSPPQRATVIMNQRHLRRDASGQSPCLPDLLDEYRDK